MTPVNQVGTVNVPEPRYGDAQTSGTSRWSA